MLTAIICALIISMICLVSRAIAGPTSFDRILACNSLGTHTVVIIGLIFLILGDASYLDVALVYALINFVSTIAFLRFYRYGSFSNHVANGETTPSSQEVLS